MVRCLCGRSLPRDLRRQRQTGQYPGVDGRTRRRRRPGGRGQSRRERLCRHRRKEPGGWSIINVFWHRPGRFHGCQLRESPMVLYYTVTTFYVIICLLLLLVILLQQGKGGDMASAFGGGSSQTAFGARGGAKLLTKKRPVCAGLFTPGSLICCGCTPRVAGI